MELLESEIRKRDLKPIQRIVFWAEFSLPYHLIVKFSKICSKCKYPLTLIFKDNYFSSIKEYLESDKNIQYVDMGTELERKDKEVLVEYTLQITRQHKFAELKREEAIQIIEEEKQFFPIIYRTIDPARRSINRIVEEEFHKLENDVIRNCVSFCSLSSFFELDLPLTVLRKAMGSILNRFLTYPELFSVLDKTHAFVKQKTDNRTNILVSIYHPLIAQRLAGIIRENTFDELLVHIGKSVDLRSRIEAEFIGKLLITKGVNYDGPKCYSIGGLKNIFNEIKKRQPARPILHHLARILAKEDINNTLIVSLLEEAIAEPPEKYELFEYKENVITTLAKIKWHKNNKLLVTKERNDTEIQDIIDLLIAAREKIPSIHTFDVHARILRDLWKNKTGIEKTNIIVEAIEVIKEGLETCVDDEDEGKFGLNQMLIEAMSEIHPEKALREAQNLLLREKDGTGYYSLALLEYFHKENITKTHKYLDKALSGDKYPPRALIFKIELGLQSKNPAYLELMNYVDILESFISFKDNWKSFFYKAIVYVINGHYDKAAENFKNSHIRAPRTLQRRVEVFWVVAGRRKMLSGKIDRMLTEREGRIYSHRVDGWKDKIFFDPKSQKNRNLILSGLLVNFELGFSPRGPIAFDVRPRERVKNF